MGVIIGILTLIVAIFDITVPLWTTKKTKDMEKELKKNIARVDEFIDDKLECHTKKLLEEFTSALEESSNNIEKQTRSERPWDFID